MRRRVEPEHEPGVPAHESEHAKGQVLGELERLEVIRGDALCEPAGKPLQRQGLQQ
jgi:hypothetical protein